MTLPKFYTVQQSFEKGAVEDIDKNVRQQFLHLGIENRVQEGQSVAIAVGSRGIAHLYSLVTAVIGVLKSLDLQPFIVPAMGSHGNATADGQIEVLKKLKITEESMGVPIISDMAAISLGRLDMGAEVFFSKDAFEANFVVPINRVKPHTAFRGEVESGLCKMLAVGLGKQKGASTLHKYGLGKALIPSASHILGKVPVLFGLAVVENAFDQIHTIKLTRPESFIDVDRQLLKLAWEMFPKIPLEHLDILIVDEMGKNISGAGMDPNVVGLWRREGGKRTPDYRIILVLDLTDESHGNAVGIGSADLTTQQVMKKIDIDTTNMNALTSGVLRSVCLPIQLKNDRIAFERALDLHPNPDQAKIARIKNTLKLQNFWVTGNCLSELSNREGIILIGKSQEIEFDDLGRIKPF